MPVERWAVAFAATFALRPLSLVLSVLLGPNLLPPFADRFPSPSPPFLGRPASRLPLFFALYPPPLWPPLGRIYTADGTTSPRLPGVEPPRDNLAPFCIPPAPPPCRLITCRHGRHLIGTTRICTHLGHRSVSLFPDPFPKVFFVYWYGPSHSLERQRP